LKALFERDYNGQPQGTTPWRLWEINSEDKMTNIEIVKNAGVREEWIFAAADHLRYHDTSDLAENARVVATLKSNRPEMFYRAGEQPAKRKSLRGDYKRFSRVEPPPLDARTSGGGERNKCQNTPSRPTGLGRSPCWRPAKHVPAKHNRHRLGSRCLGAGGLAASGPDFNFQSRNKTMSQFMKPNTDNAGFNALSGKDGPTPVDHTDMPALYKTLDKPMVDAGEQSKRLKQQAKAVPQPGSFGAFAGNGKQNVQDPRLS
jgi:hypothetical protein